MLLLDAGVVEIDPTYAWSMQVSCDINAPFIRLSCAKACGRIDQFDKRVRRCCQALALSRT